MQSDKDRAGEVMFGMMVNFMEEFFEILPDIIGLSKLISKKDFCESDRDQTALYIKKIYMFILSNEKLFEYVKLVQNEFSGEGFSDIDKEKVIKWLISLEEKEE